MGKKWFVSILAILACFTIPHQGEAEAPSPSRGKETFEKRCSGCHALDKDKEGPRLRGVYGRLSGSVAAFPYSDGLKKAAITWDDEALERWLTNPEAMVPDTDMGFHVGDAAE